MTVFVVWSYLKELIDANGLVSQPPNFEGIFSTKEKAQPFIDKHQEMERYPGFYPPVKIYFIDEQKVD